MIDLDVGERRYLRIKAAHRKTGEKIRIGMGGKGQGQQQLAAPDQRPQGTGSSTAKGPHAELAAGGQPQQAQQRQQISDSGVTWETSDQSVVRVEGSGEGAWITGVKEGSATVEAQFDADLGDGVRMERAALAVTVHAGAHKTGAWLESGTQE
jgi:hypothetical protein